MDIKQVIDELGGAREVADIVGVSFQAVYKWQKVPAEHVMTLVPLLKCKPEDLRPDVFRKPAKTARR